MSAVGAQSALRVALRRAAHQLVDEPVIFRDPFAVPLLERAHAAALQRTPVRRDRPWSIALRAFAVARSCYAEEQLAAAVKRGVRQYCLLGAGLDTFAWRNPYPGLRVWEVDQPAMQQWKRALADQARLPEPLSRTTVAADLGDRNLAATLSVAGLKQTEPTVFALLGVAPYLERETFRDLLRLVQAHGAGSALILDYRLPRAALPDEEQRQHDSLAARVEASGEPFRSWWTPRQMAAELRAFTAVEDLDTAAINARYFVKHGASREDGLAARGQAMRLVCAHL